MQGPNSNLPCSLLLAPSSILFEDNHLLVVNKPAGMPSQDDITGDLSAEKWAMNYIREKYNKPGNVYVGLLHRLDPIDRTPPTCRALRERWPYRERVLLEMLPRLHWWKLAITTSSVAALGISQVI